MDTSNARSASSATFYALDRLLFLIDGVFAITLTLLVLDLKLEPGAGDHLQQALIGLAPRLMTYFFAFASISTQWYLHHRGFRLVEHADSRLIGLSFAYLLCVTLIPATTAILGDASADPLAAAVFSANTLLLCLVGWAIWSHLSSKRELLASDVDPRLLPPIARVWRHVALGFAAALVLGFVSVYIAYAIWFVLPITMRWLR